MFQMEIYTHTHTNDCGEEKFFDEFTESLGKFCNDNRCILGNVATFNSKQSKFETNLF